MRDLKCLSRLTVGTFLIVLLTGVAVGQTGGPKVEFRSALRGDTPLNEEASPPRMEPQSNTDIREVRNYPEQPPIIPHTTEAYQIDANVNKCLSCHSRTRVGESRAPMVSITHFMDRDGQFLASVSPRRYFCNQCHVPQHPSKAPVENTFIDSDRLLSAKPGTAQ